MQPQLKTQNGKPKKIFRRSNYHEHKLKTNIPKLASVVHSECTEVFLLCDRGLGRPVSQLSSQPLRSFQPQGGGRERDIELTPTARFICSNRQKRVSGTNTLGLCKIRNTFWQELSFFSATMFLVLISSDMSSPRLLFVSFCQDTGSSSSVGLQNKQTNKTPSSWKQFQIPSLPMTVTGRQRTRLKNWVRNLQFLYTTPSNPRTMTLFYP